jgi:hypothetical protein
VVRGGRHPAHDGSACLAIRSDLARSRAAKRVLIGSNQLIRVVGSQSTRDADGPRLVDASSGMRFDGRLMVEPVMFSRPAR